MAKPIFPSMFDETYQSPDYRPDAPMAPGILARGIKNPGFFDGGGTGSKIGSFILEALTGVPSAAHREQRQDRDLDMFKQKSMLEQQIARMGQAEDRDYNESTWRAHQDYIAAHPAVPQAVQLAKAAGLQEGTPEWTSALTAALPGYGYTQPVIDAKAAAQQKVAAFRGQQSASLKAQPTYAQTHPKASGGGGHGGKTAATRVVGGKAYYKINGGWYDNPEGR